MHPIPCRLRLAAFAVSLLACGSAGAITVDAKALARFDHSYGHCEQQIPAMRGRRDEAWLSLWRTRADDTHRAELAKARQSAAYATERKRVQKAQAAGAAPASSSPIDQQCEALWAQTQRMAAKPRP